MPKILVIDDRPERVRYIKKNLNGSKNDPYEVDSVSNWKELKKIISQKYDEYDLMIFDVDFSDLADEELLRSGPPDESDIRQQGYLLLKALREWEIDEWKIREKSVRFVKVIFTSAVASSIAGRESDIDRYSVDTYLHSEGSPEDPKLVNKILRLCPYINENRIEEWKSYGIVCGKSRRMYKLMSEAEIIAQQDCNVWIDGPTGSGKELMARFIHQRSKRAMDLGAILLNLLDELKQLDEIGLGVFSSDVSSLRDKINIDITKSVGNFERIQEEGKINANVLNDLPSTLSDFGIKNDMIEKITNSLNDFSGSKKAVAKCLLQIATIWNESQIRDDAERRLFNFRDINCATFAEERVLLAKLFGVPTGVFTDVSMSPGLFKSTSYMYGTLFLDEIGDLSLEAQAALLRILQENKFERVNSNISEKINVRAIASTNKNINELIKSGLFRYDLYMRLAQARIQLPSLKERMEDFDELAEEFLKRKWNEYGEKGIDREIKFDENRAINFLKSQDQIWKGNIRALQNIVNRAYEMAYIEGSNTIDIDHIKRTLQIFDGLVNQEVVNTQEQNYETAKDVVKQLLELIQSKNITETNIEDDKEISIDDIKLWLDKAFKRINLNSCTNENLQDLIEWISKLFILKAIDSNTNIRGKRLYSHVARIMEINPRQIYSNNQISTLKIKDLIDGIAHINIP